MPFASFTCDVGASVETLWRLLEDKIANPGKYLPEVESVEILERAPEGTLRRLRTAVFEVTERVTADRARLEVDYALVDHPEFAGHTVDRVTPAREDEPEGRPLLTLILDWRPLDGTGAADEDLLEAITTALLQTKELAEETERARRAEP